MNKKFIIPILLCCIIVIVMISQCIGGGHHKVILTWNPVPNPELINDSIELKVYVENSGSMDAYMCDGSNLKDAVYDYISDLKNLTDTYSLYYINSKVIPYNGNLQSYIKDLTPKNFAKYGGNRANTDLRQMIDTIIKTNGEKTVSIFVSDCILDLEQNTTDFLGNCQVSVKNTFNEALQKNPHLCVEIIKLDSKFEGFWYCGHNKEYLKDVKRPYYIWVIGDQRNLAKFNKKVPIDSIFGGIKEYCAYSVSQPIPFDITNSTFVTNGSKKIDVEILANFNNALQKKELYKKLVQYKVSTPSQATITSVTEILDKKSKYTHVINIEIKNPETLRSETITFSYPYLAAWVEQSDDITGQNIKENLDKTTGLMALIKGVAEAYKDHTDYGNIYFEINNK